MLNVKKTWWVQQFTLILGLVPPLSYIFFPLVVQFCICELKVVCVAYSTNATNCMVYTIENTIIYEKIDFPMLCLRLMFGFRNVRYNNEGGKSLLLCLDLQFTILNYLSMGNRLILFTGSTNIGLCVSVYIGETKKLFIKFQFKLILS